MGVDYYTCDGCSDTFADCSRYRTDCGEDFGGCGRVYCSPECAKLVSPGRDHAWTWQEYDKLTQEEQDAASVTCVNCRGEHAKPTCTLPKDLVQEAIKALSDAGDWCGSSAVKTQCRAVECKLQQAVEK
jgi:hypothetical protein